MCFSSCLSLFAGLALSYLFLCLCRLVVNVDSHRRAMRAVHEGRRGQPIKPLFVSAYRLFDRATIIAAMKVSLTARTCLFAARAGAAAGVCSSSRS